MQKAKNGCIKTKNKAQQEKRNSTYYSLKHIKIEKNRLLNAVGLLFDYCASATG